MFLMKIVLSRILQCLFGTGSVIDMRLHRFYVSQPLGEVVVISARGGPASGWNETDKLKQWTKVFRYKKGDFVVLFNGDGADNTYLIDTISSDSCVLIHKELTPSYSAEKKVTLYLSIIKKDNFELVVQKVTELGVTTIVPVLSERSEKKNLNEERLQKIAIESSEQCGRGDIPNILPIISLSDVLESPLPHDLTCVLQMSGASINSELVQNDISSTKSIGIFIGPEGGWSEDEEKLFKSKNITPISLGKNVLRAETAGIVATAYMLQ